MLSDWLMPWQFIQIRSAFIPKDCFTIDNLAKVHTDRYKTKQGNTKA